VHADALVVVAGSNNQPGSSSLALHRGVIPVAGCTRHGSVQLASATSRSLGLHGVRAPAEGLVGLTATGSLTFAHGISVATAIVTATLALLWSEYPSATALLLRCAVLRTARHRTVIPPLLDAVSAWKYLNRSAQIS
jgi:hypothetical protein